MRPLNNYVLVKPVSQEKVKGGVILLESKSNNFKRGIIFCPSDQVTQVAPGDEVLYYRARVHNDVPIGDEKLDLISEDGLMVEDPDNKKGTKVGA